MCCSRRNSGDRYYSRRYIAYLRYSSRYYDRGYYGTSYCSSRRYHDCHYCRRYRDRRDTGTAGLIVRGAAGALIGLEITRGGNRCNRRGNGTTGAIVGGAVGALVGRVIARSCYTNKHGPARIHSALGNSKSLAQSTTLSQTL